jgi:DNA-binding CsgD family transcriptional regulator
VPTYRTAQERPLTVSTPLDDGHGDTHQGGQGDCEDNPRVNETIEIFSRQPEWAGIKAKLATRLRSAGVREESIEEVSDIAIRRILDAKSKGVDIEIVKWTLAWEVVTSYIFKDLPEGKKRRFRLYSERIGRMGLQAREQRVAFYIVWGLGNKEIAEKIGRDIETVKKQVTSLRRKLGIGPVGLDDRVNTVLTLLGL